MSPTTPAANNAFAPFHHRTYLLLWSATLFSSMGTWMQDLGAGWLMTKLETSPAIVVLVQASTSLPIFLFALFAGAIADTVDRRKLLLSVNILLSLIATVFAVLVYSEQMTTHLLLALTFLMGTGAAFSAPAFQSIVPSLVPREELPAAIALNAIAMNISRALGPALAGVLISAVSLAAPFAFNAVSYWGTVLVLARWQPAKSNVTHALPAEPVFSAMLTGLRYVFYSRPLKNTLWRTLAFFIFASAYWSMTPVIARQLLKGDPHVYGLLMASVGVGAVAAAMVLPRLRRTLGRDWLVALGTIGTAGALLIFAFFHQAPAAYAASMLAGASWISVLSSLNTSAQTALPDWVRGRGLAIFLTVAFGSMATGSVIWGRLAHDFDIPTALISAAMGALSFIPLTWHIKLGKNENLDLTPSLHWPNPVIRLEDSMDRGPVLISIEYNIDPNQAPAFIDAIERLACQRRRDGAIEWGVFQDSEQPELWIESFTASSWVEHLRQHRRITKQDEQLQALVNSFHRGTQPPKVRHLLAPSAQLYRQAELVDPLNSANTKEIV